MGMGYGFNREGKTVVTGVVPANGGTPAGGGDTPIKATGEHWKTYPLNGQSVAVVHFRVDKPGLTQISTFEGTAGKNYYGWFWISKTPNGEPLPAHFKMPTTPSGVVWGGGAVIYADVGATTSSPFWMELATGDYCLNLLPDTPSTTKNITFSVKVYPPSA